MHCGAVSTPSAVSLNTVASNSRTRSGWVTDISARSK
ncbi:Uncharacterised protein [Mycobacterium tuberculosis]|uniref:Uncharacterized protein n=1 Tax=Mycobacterium tuberculosis TaxID=1773 RepID=A0A916PH02_MYCTX|nr:Uncharacterised protein [Mycobacterium tuberculosis]COZ26729.1 Uncharacterised protein [Mycobacterium tuberculosis]